MRLAIVARGVAMLLEIAQGKRNFVAAREEGLACC
jgi:hypothetical protein